MGALNFLQWGRILLASLGGLTLSANGQNLQWSGDLADGTVPARSIVVITGNTRVPPGATVTLGAGTVIKVSGSLGLTVEGTLLAQGTRAEPIIFTEIADDSAGGDTDNNGPTGGFPGRWGQVRFTASSGASVLQNVEFRYGGAGASAEVTVEGAPVRFEQCTFRLSRADGMRINGGNPVISGCNFLGNWASALSMDLSSNPAISGGRTATNAINGLSLDTGSLPVDGVWDDPDVAYHLKGTVTVPAGRKLTIGAGQVIKLWGQSLLVSGTLVASGTDGQPIVFSSLRDDSIGGDTNNDGPGSGFNGDWGRVEFTAPSSGNELAHVEFRYGGAGAAAEVILDHTPARFLSCVFRHSRIDGLRIITSNPTISAANFYGNWESALSMDLSSNPAIQGIQTSANRVNGLSLDAGTLSADGVWDDPDVIYHLRGAVTVPVGKKLAIGAGQVIKAWGQAGLSVAGVLRAAGTAGQPIIFTSLRDDAIGGDTNNDGPGSGFNGDWGRVEFTGTGEKSELAHVQFRFGGSGSAAQVSVAGAPVEFTGCLFRYSRADGLRITSSNPLVSGGEFFDSWGSALSMNLAANPKVEGISVGNNGVNGLSVDEGTLPNDNSWDDPDVVYYLRGDVTIPTGHVLNIAPGQVIKVWGKMMSIAGTLHALGTDSEPIIFTSLRDDSIGGDTNNDRISAGFNGDWGRLDFGPTSVDSDLAYVQFRYGAAGSSAMVEVHGAPVRFTGCEFRHSRQDGLRILGSSAIVAQCFFHDNWVSAISQDLAASPVITRPEIRSNGINALSLDGGTLSADASWDDPDVVYYLKDSITVQSGRKLTIAAGQVIKLWGGRMLSIAGTLEALGIPVRSIVFTSLRDDSIGGDTNNDGPGAGFNGEWARLEFTSTSVDNRLAHLEFRYGGGSDSAGTIVFSGGQANLNACLIRMSSSHAVAARNGAHLALVNSILAQNWNAGLRVDSGAVVDAFNNTIDSNERGVWADAATVTLVNNFVTTNRSAGVTLTGNTTLNARYNGFHNARNFDGLPAVTGKDGNIDKDPLYVDAKALNFTLKPESPGVDAGFGDGAPPLDFLEQARVDDPEHANTGAGNPPYVDIGAIELDRWLSKIDAPRRGGQIVLGDTLRFAGTGQALDGTAGFSWNFGSGQTSLLEDPGLVTFRSLGPRTITFTAIGADGRPDPNPATMELTVMEAIAPLPDLEVEQIAPLTQLAVGQTIDIAYEVKNRGQADVTGKTWMDAVYLSSDPYLDSGDVKLDSQTVNRTVPAGGGYTNTLHATINSSQLQSGVLYLIVSVDDEWALLEERRLNNELGLPTDVAIPELRSGIPHAAQFTRAGAGQFYHFEVAAGENLHVRLDDLNGRGVNEVYLRRGQLPSREAYDARFETTASANQELIIPAPTPGTWYLLAFGASVPDSGDYTIQVDEAALTLGELFPNRSGQLDGVQFRVRGAGFVPGAKVELVGTNGASYPAAAVSVDSFSLLDMKLNLAAIAPGTYGLRVQTGDTTATIDKALTVMAGGQSRLETQLIVPDMVGYHQLATLYVEYRNTGTAAMPAPLIAVSGIQNGQERALLTLDAARITTGLWVAGLPEGFSHTVHFLASGEIPGWLHPGESGRVPVYYAGWLQPWDLSYPPINFNLLATTTESQMPIDWTELESTLKPGAISAEAWKVVAANLHAEIGSTWGSLMTALSQDAAYLGQIGQRISDATTLFGFELAQADGSFPFNRLEREVDAVALTPGLPLVFERTFPALISARFEMGPLGRGWKHCWETVLKVASDGSVVLRTRAGGISIFQPDLRGGYVPASGDYGNLTKLSDGRFRLRDLDGITSLYRSDGRLESLEDANGRKINLEYTGTLLTKLHHSGGSEFQFAYSSAGRLARLTDERGQVITFTYDPAEEHLINIQYPQGRLVTYRYGTTGAQIHALLEKQDTERGNHYYTYDDRGRVAAVRFGGDSPQITLDYKPGGEVLMTAGTSGGTFYFDQEGRLVKARDAKGLVRQTVYDPQGRLTELIDPLGRRTSARYDSRGHLISVTDVLGHTSSLAYDANGELSAITDSNGQVVRYEQDAHGNLVKMIQPDATAENYIHNADGQLTQWIRPNGAKISFTYNSVGRVTKIQADDGTVYTYGYDSRGYLTNTTDVSGTTRYTYNTSNLVSRVDLPSGRLLGFSYDSLGRRSTMKDETGFTVQYRYNATGRLQRLEDAQGKMLAEYHYNGAGRLERVDKGNGTFTTYTYGANGRMVGITNHNSAMEILSQFNWLHDDFGRIASLDSHQGHWTYSYDALGQLTAAHFISSLPELPDQDLKFEYDAAGNRIRTTSQGNETLYTVNALNQYTQDGDARIAYDTQGGLSTRTEGNQSWHYSYDAIGRITQVETPGATWRYEYDALGNRVAAIHGDQRQEFVYDPFSAGNVVGEYQGAGALLAHYAHGVGLVGRFDATGSAQFYDFDQIGSTAGLSDASGTYANEYAYSPFGALMATRETVPNPFRYVGQYGVTMDGSGLYHMQARDYLPDTGRFLSRDPFGPRAGLNPYTYVANNPVSMIDPSGEEEGVPGFDVFFDGSGQSQVLYIFRNAYERGWGRFFDAMREHGFMSEQDQGYLDRGWQSFEGVLELQNVYNWLDDAEGKLVEWGRDVSTDLSVSFATTEESVTTWLGNTWTGIKSDVSNWYNQQVPRRVELVTQWFSAMLPRVRSTIDDALRWIGNTWNSVVAWALDPNEKTAPAGGGTNHYVVADGMLTYRIDFENDAQATAPAQYVSIVDDLHSDLDWTTFELGEFAFGDQFISVPPGSRNYSIDKPISYLGQQLLVQVRAELNLESGRLQVVFSTIDPATGLPPSVLLGFLPPEDGTGRGQGYISYRIRPKAGLPSGTQISNVARINFDFTQTIATDQIDPHDPSKGVDPTKQARNILDAAAPVSRIKPLPAISPLANFTVSWEATDEANGSGVFGVDIFVSANGSTWTLWKAMASGTDAVFSGSPGKSYAFYSMAHDYAGHVELAPEFADATTTISGTAGVQIGITRSADGVLTLTWASASGQRYTLLEAPTVNGPWTIVSGQNKIPGTGADISYNLSPIGSAKFYRSEIDN